MLPVRVVDYVSDGVAYYYPRDRKECLPGYKLYEYHSTYHLTGEAPRSYTSKVYVKGGASKALKLINHWNVIGYPHWYYYLFPGVVAD